METSVKKIKNLPLRKYLVFSVLITLAIIVLLSVATIFGCMTFRKYLLPESNNVFLTVDETYADRTNVSYSMRVKVGEEGAELPVLMSEDGTAAASKQTKYTIQRIENSVDSLTPKRKLAYRFCGAVMIVFPLLFSIVGILLCGFHFYRKKLSVPLNLLSDATKQISDRDLDFHLQYENEDEMGILCGSFEQMRQTLRENYREMWNLLEERRLLQASIAHDLRNPIAVIEGYTEYLQMNLAKGKLNNQRVLKIAENLNLAARRLEHYTESVRTLNQMEDMEVNRQKVKASDFVSDMEEDLQIMAQKRKIRLTMDIVLENIEIWVDPSILYRVLENVFGNALRYAKERVRIEVSLENQLLSFTIIDDGNGFSEEVLTRQKKLLLAKPSEDGHLGMGLAISRILCKKHGGCLEIRNDVGHYAVVNVTFSVNDTL